MKSRYYRYYNALYAILFETNNQRKYHSDYMTRVANLNV